MLNTISKDLTLQHDIFNDLLTKENIYCIENTEMSYDLMELSIRWCDSKSIKDCNEVLNDSNIFVGDFIKAILKINNAALELEKVAELLNNLELLEKLHQIPELTLKYVVNNESLYV